MAEIPRFPQVENTALSQSVIAYLKNMKAKSSLPCKRNSNTLESYQNVPIFHPTRIPAT
jgi:hypothetical protein